MGIKRTVLKLCLLILIAARAAAQFDAGQFAKELEEVLPQFNVTGLAIAIIQNDSTIFSRGFGWRDAEKRLPVTSQSLFNIASCSKAFTAAAMAQLESEKKIAWKDKVIEYIPGFRLTDPYITAELNITDILTHRSGLGTFYGDLLWYGTSYTTAEIIHRMRYLPITQDFRSSYGYQNNMYLLAGEIIKKMSGLSWENYIKEKFFIPLEMFNAKTSSQELEPGMDIAYPHLNGKIQKLYIDDPHAAYSIYANTEDLSHWVRMLLQNGLWRTKKVLPEEAIEKIFEPQMILPLNRNMRENKTNFRAYGLGWFMYDYAGRKIIEHDGGMPGYISKITLVPAEKIGFVLLTNDMTNIPSALRNIILDSFFGISDSQWLDKYSGYLERYKEIREQKKQQRYMQRKKDSKPSLSLTSYSGVYEDKMYGEATVLFRNDSLILTLLPTQKWFTSPLEHWHYDTFRIKFRDEFLPEGFVTFDFDTDKKITGFKIDLPNPDFHFFNLNFKKVNEQIISKIKSSR